MKTDSYGQVIVNADDAFTALYNNTVKDFSGLMFDDQSTVDQFNKAVSLNADHIPKLSLKYLVDTMRENNVVWGVGRGSSVASYILYLLGVHKVDSIKYGLDIHEFLKGAENG